MGIADVLCSHRVLIMTVSSECEFFMDTLSGDLPGNTKFDRLYTFDLLSYSKLPLCNKVCVPVCEAILDDDCKSSLNFYSNTD